MIDLNQEPLISIAEAARLRPPGRSGRPTHPSTVYRWIGVGVRGVKLEAVRLGGSLYTSREAIQRFGERLTAGATRPDRGQTSTARRRAYERAGRKLDRLGI
jgi:hypothetical protein